MTNEELDKWATDKAMELLKGCSPYTNVIPTKELVLQAYWMGYDVVKRPSERDGGTMRAMYPGSYQMWPKPDADGAIGVRLDGTKIFPQGHMPGTPGDEQA